MTWECNACGRTNKTVFNSAGNNILYNCDCETRANARELETLQSKVNDYNRCHQFSTAYLLSDDDGPYVKVRHN